MQSAKSGIFPAGSNPKAHPVMIFAISCLFYIAFIFFELAAVWKVYTKANQPGWASIIPFYNFYVMLKIVGRPGWWLLLLLVPLANIIIAIIVLFDLAKSFGKGVGFGFGLLFLGFIFYPILGFGSATYQGPTAGK